VTLSGGPGRAASFAELVKVVETLREEVKGLRRDLVPRDELRTARRRAVAIILVSALLTMTVENTALSACFLSPPAVGSPGRTTCGIAFPGYAGAMRQGDERLARFRDVLSQIPANRAANVDQDARIKRLEAEIAKLRGQP
jgi:cell division protein FtsB